MIFKFETMKKLFLAAALTLAAITACNRTSKNDTKSPLQKFIEFRKEVHEFDYSLSEVMDSLALYGEYRFDVEDADGMRIMIIYTSHPDRNAITRYEHYYASTGHAVEHYIELDFDKFFYYNETKSGPTYRAGQFEVYDFNAKKGKFTLDAASSALFKLDEKDFFTDETPETILSDAWYHISFEITDAHGQFAEHRLNFNSENYDWTQWMKGNVISFDFEDGKFTRSAPFFDDAWTSVNSIVSGNSQSDISQLWGNERYFIGGIGDEYQKMGIVFLTTIKISENQYEVTGKSKVRDNICDFKGIMEVQEVKFHENDRQTVDVISGTYNFSEDRNQSHAGEFEGEFTIWWFENINIIFNIGEKFSGNRDANGARYLLPTEVAFSGTWRSYSTEATKSAKWGNTFFHLPGGFNDGGEYIQAENYSEIGWGPYFDRHSEDDQTRQNAEKEYQKQWVEWWK